MKKKNKKFENLKKAYKIYCDVIIIYNFFKSRGFKKLNDLALLENAGELLVGEESSIPSVAQVKDLKAYFNPYFMLITLRIGSIAFVNPETRICVVDYTFMKFPKDVQEFILYHEYGHLIHEHGQKGNVKTKIMDGLSYKITRPLYALTGKVHPWEIQADTYAVSMVGKNTAIEALNELIKVNPFDFISNKEIKNRIKAIKNK